VQQHRHADADRLPVHRREQRLVEGGERAQHLHHRVLGGELRSGEEILQVVAGAEPGALPAQQHRARGLVALRSV